VIAKQFIVHYGCVHTQFHPPHLINVATLPGESSFLSFRIQVCKYDFRRVHKLRTESLQHDASTDTSAVSCPLPYNLYWQRRQKLTSKEIARELGTDSTQICK